jgi:D-aminopeptidase
MKKQLVICTDMEGASGIFEENYKAMIHGTEEWKNVGRECMTSDVLAVCEAANEFGIDDIMIYDGHYAGNPEPNIITEKLPANVRLFDTPDRRFQWRRIRGQAQQEPYGIITVGQHARYGEKNAYFPHTIQSPPIERVLLNGIHIAEIGHAVLNFRGVKYIANIGCNASMKEAKELSETVAAISVKDKTKGWEPSPKETYPIIKKGVLDALRNIEIACAVNIEPPYEFSMTLFEGYKFETPNKISWKGHFDKRKAFWEAPSVEMGLELFGFVREFTVRDGA